MVKLSRQLNLNDKISFLGHISREETLRHMALADVLLYPSLKDAGAWVLFESLAAGLPPICFDYAGPAEIITTGCGMKIPVTNPKQAPQDFAAALELLGNDEKLRVSLSTGAKRRAKDFDWDRKGEIIDKIYRRVH
jgi:glycosyltransferase involved in cell wall biosynthesis